MKKVLLTIVAILGFSTASYAGVWKVEVYIQEFYEYVSTDNKHQFTESAGGQSQTITVMANSEPDAKIKANAECGRMCRDKRFVRNQTIEGVQYKVYLVRYATTGYVYEQK